MRPRLEERGAVAVISALLATVLLGCAALAVDLGNAMNRKAQTQTDVDMAALAGGAELPAPSTTPAAGHDEVKAIARYLIRNDVYDDAGSGSFKSGSIPGSTLDAQVSNLAPKLVPSTQTAADKANYGSVRYGYWDRSGAAPVFVPSVNYITLEGPTRRVQFGVANAFGVSGANVSGTATVGIKSKGSVSAIPFYAYSGCDWGHQVINHDTSNSSTGTFYTSGDWALTNDADQPTLNAPINGLQNSDPQQLQANQPQTLTITGTNFRDKVGTDPKQKYVESVGFFLPNSALPVLEIPRNQITFVNNTTIRVPGTIATTGQNGQTYYIRTKWHTYTEKGNGDLKDEVFYGSAVIGSLAYVQIGDTTLFCNDQKSSGNFGTLSVVRFDGSNNNSNDGWLPINIAKGLDSPKVKLNTYNPPNPITPSSCDNSDSKAFQSDSTNQANGDKINCVVTDTGFAQNPATAGFITGGSSGAGMFTGRLAKVDSGCGGSPAGKPKTRNVTISGKGSYTLNDERLTCYLTNTTTTLAQVSSSSYAGTTVFTSDIFSSPRFVFVPIINEQPSNGKKSFPIINYRPAFITGESGAAYKGHPETDTYYVNASGVVGGSGGATDNGFTVDNNSVNSFQVVFINPAALPPIPADGQLVDYVPGSPPQLVLVN